MYKLKNRIYSTSNVIANAMSIFNNTPHSALKRHSLPQGAREQRSVAFSNKVMDTHLPLPAGIGDKYCDVDSRWQYGRSMIEMLGVLAIIGVLSVGGISGYSKAMTKFKVNKAIEEYSYLIYGLLEHLDEIQKISKPTGDKYDITELIDALQLVPKTWIIQRSSGHGVNYNYLDQNQNWVSIFSRNNLLVFDIAIGGLTADENQKDIAANFSANFCVELLNNIAFPLHSTLYKLFLYRSKGGGESFYGDNYCKKNQRCISSLTVAEMHKVCSACSGTEICTVTLEF